MKSVDFSAIIIKDINGNEQAVDMRLMLGNTLYMQGQNIEECELGRSIYHQKPSEPMELSEDNIKVIKRFAEQIQSYVTRKSILDAIE